MVVSRRVSNGWLSNAGKKENVLGNAFLGKLGRQNERINMHIG